MHPLSFLFDVSLTNQSLLSHFTTQSVLSHNSLTTQSLVSWKSTIHFLLFFFFVSQEPSKYEFSYKITHDEGAEQGHQASNVGVKSSGQYYVNLAGGEKQTVNYVADERGYHPYYSFKSASSESHFKLGDSVKPLVSLEQISLKFSLFHLSILQLVHSFLRHSSYHL